MSFVEIVNALPALKRSERRELARRIFEVDDEETALLRDCDRRADERFQMLDEMEEQDGQTSSC